MRGLLSAVQAKHKLRTVRTNLAWAAGGGGGQGEGTPNYAPPNELTNHFEVMYVGETKLLCKKFVDCK